MVLLYADVVNMWGWFLIEGPTPNSGCPHDPQRKPMKLRLLSKHSHWKALGGSSHVFFTPVILVTFCSWGAAHVTHLHIRKVTNVSCNLMAVLCGSQSYSPTDLLLLRG